MGVLSGVWARRRDLLVVAGFVLLLHLPFVTQPVQGDEVNYLDVARHVFTEPLTPTDFSFVFQGHRVEMSGHPHPPLNAYLLTIPWFIAGGFSVPVFHLFFIAFAIAIGWAAYWLALYFTPHPLWAALLVSACPLVEVNSNTVAGPEPALLAFLLIGAAAFFGRRFVVCGIALTLAAFTALQAFAIPPILLLAYLFKRERPPRAAWIALAAPYVAMVGWQALQFAVTGALPAANLTANMTGAAYGGLKLRAESAAAMIQHLGVLVIVTPLALRRLWGVVPGAALAAFVHDYAWWERGMLVVCVALGFNALLWLWESRKRQPILAAWCLLYFGFALLVFFAGASRYLLPLTAPMAILFVLQFGERRSKMALAVAAAVFLGMNVSFAAYEFSRVYADVPPPPGKTFLVNGEWGFRYYMLQRGGRMIETSSVAWPGEWIVSSQLSLAGDYDSQAEESASFVRARDLWVRTPLRLIDKHAHSGFSAASSGLLPFSFASGPLDRVTYRRTSLFLDAPASWHPTELDGRLVYLAPPGAVRVTMPANAKELRFALYGQGSGRANFRIQDDAGAVVFEKAADVNGELWAPGEVNVHGGDELMLTAEGALKLGWGELDSGGDVGIEREGAPAGEPRFSVLDMGDVRCRPQLVSGWYTIESGAWRWMAKDAEAVLHMPAGGGVLHLKLYFPPDHMTQTGGPVTVSVSVNGQSLEPETYSEPGGYELTRALPESVAASPAVRVRIHLDRAVPPSGNDQRELGAVVSELGLGG